jgi:hypothetical protein
MKSSVYLGIVVGPVIRDRGGDVGALVEPLVDGPEPTVVALRALRDVGLSLDEIIEVFAQYEALLGKHEPQPTLLVKLPEKPPAPRVRELKYGPAQDPDTYMSGEKLRAYNHAASWVDGPPTPRLPEAEWLPLVGATFRRDNFVCTYCGADGREYKLHCDHIIPVSRGGSNHPVNLTTACDYCNCSKRDALPHEWRPLRAVPQ